MSEESVLLLEHHGKQLLASHGIAVPAGVYVASAADLAARELPSGPWMVKAQVATGGRGKAGAVRPADTTDEIARIIGELVGTSVKGKPIQGFRIEQRVAGAGAGAGAHEAYVSLSIDAETARITLLVSAKGGIDIETQADTDRVAVMLTGPGHAAEAAEQASDMLPQPLRNAIRQAATRLAKLFFACEATLLEVNPLFVMADGQWIVGDLKLVLDDNAIVRQPVVRALVEQHADAYPEAARKLLHGFDYVEIDRDGEIGLVTTGAGLSMKLMTSC
jgi:succinyl-CoA synthetase beta subunit